jgi:hypothetical protein
MEVAIRQDKKSIEAAYLEALKAYSSCLGSAKTAGDLSGRTCDYLLPAALATGKDFDRVKESLVAAERSTDRVLKDAEAKGAIVSGTAYRMCLSDEVLLGSCSKEANGFALPKNLPAAQPIIPPDAAR